jgi:hypothetical protein
MAAALGQAQFGPSAASQNRGHLSGQSAPPLHSPSYPTIIDLATMFCIEAAAVAWENGFRHHSLAEWVLRATSVPWTDLDEKGADSDDAADDDDGTRGLEGEASRRGSLVDRRLGSFLSSPSTGALADLYDGEGEEAAGLPFHEAGVDFTAAFKALPALAKGTGRRGSVDLSPDDSPVVPPLQAPQHGVGFFSSRRMNDGGYCDPRERRTAGWNSNRSCLSASARYERAGAAGFHRLCSFVGSFRSSELRSELYRELAALLPLPESSFDEFSRSLPPLSHDAMVDPKQAAKCAGQAVRSFGVWMNLSRLSASFAHLSELFSCAQTWRSRFLQLAPEEMRADAGRLSHAARKACAVEDALIERNITRCQIAIHNCYEEPPRSLTLLQQMAAGPAPPRSAAGDGQPAVLPAAAQALRQHGFPSSAVPIHQALACGTLATAGMYLSLGSSREALQCAELAILNGHQAANIADETLPMSHLMKMKCHVAIGNAAAAAEDASIALQLATASFSPAADGSGAFATSPLMVHVLCNTLLSSAALLVHHTSTVDRNLRSALMQVSGGHLYGGGHSTAGEDRGGPSSGRGAESGVGASSLHQQSFFSPGGQHGSSGVIELVETIPQTIHATLHAVEWLALMHLDPLAQRLLTLQREVLSFSAFSYGCASLAPHIAALASEVERDASLSIDTSVCGEGPMSPFNHPQRRPATGILFDLVQLYIKHSFWRILLDVQGYDGHDHSVSDLEALITSVGVHFGSKYKVLLSSTSLLRSAVLLKIGVGLADEGYQAAAYDVFSAVVKDVLSEAHFPCSFASTSIKARDEVASQKHGGSAGGAGCSPADSKASLPWWSTESLHLLSIAAQKCGEAALYLSLAGPCRQMADLLEQVGTLCSFAVAIAHAAFLRALLLQHEQHYAEAIGILEPLEPMLNAAGLQHYLNQLRLRLASVFLSRNDVEKAVAVLRMVEQSACSTPDWRLRQSLVLSCEVRQDRAAAVRRARHLLSQQDASGGRLAWRMVVVTLSLRVLPNSDPLHLQAAASAKQLRATLVGRHRAQTVAVLPTAAHSSLSELCALAAEGTGF